MKFEIEFLVPGDLIWLPEGVGLFKISSVSGTISIFTNFRMLEKPKIGLLLKLNFDYNQSLVFCLGEKWVVSSNKIKLYQPKNGGKNGS